VIVAGGGGSSGSHSSGNGNGGGGGSHLPGWLILIVVLASIFVLLFITGLIWYGLKGVYYAIYYLVRRGHPSPEDWIY
jgi:hypothetical protein